MIDVVTIASELSLPIKVAWAVWLVWASVLVEWYLRGRSMRTDRLPHTDGRPSGSRRKNSTSDSSIAPS